MESKLDYRTPEVELRNKMRQAGEDIQRLRRWVGGRKEKQEVLREAGQMKLLERVFDEQYVVQESEAVEVRSEESRQGRDSTDGRPFSSQ